MRRLGGKWLGETSSDERFLGEGAFWAGLRALQAHLHDEEVC